MTLLDRKGRFSYHARVTNVLSTQGDTRFDATETLRGMVGGSQATGTYRETLQYHNLRGQYIGRCLTPSVRWSAHPH